MQPKIRGWKEGVLSENISNAYGTTFLKGQLVRYKKIKEKNMEFGTWTGNFEYHYVDVDNIGLIRMPKLLID